MAASGWAPCNGQHVPAAFPWVLSFSLGQAPSQWSHCLPAVYHHRHRRRRLLLGSCGSLCARHSLCCQRLRGKRGKKAQAHPPGAQQARAPVGVCSSCVCLHRHLARQAAASKPVLLLSQNSPTSSGRDGTNVKPWHLHPGWVQGTDARLSETNRTGFREGAGCGVVPLCLPQPEPSWGEGRVLEGSRREWRCRTAALQRGHVLGEQLYAMIPTPLVPPAQFAMANITEHAHLACGTGV